MTPIYDANGRVCAWLLDDTLRNLSGRVIAFLRDEHIYGVTGRHLGIWDDGNIRDHRGDVMAWLVGARGGPVKPVPGVPPVPPVPNVPPVPAVPTFGWSRLDFEGFSHQ